MFKKKKKNQEPKFIEIYFASKQNLKVYDLKEAIGDTEALNYWKILDILEYSFTEETSLTITPLDSDFSSKDLERLESLNIKTILEVSFNEEVINETYTILKDLCQKFDAVLLNDDENLTIINL